MFCPACGHELPDDSLFCAFCGANIGAILNEQPRQKLTFSSPDSEAVESPAPASTPAPAPAPDTTDSLPAIPEADEAPGSASGVSATEEAPANPSEKRRRIAIAASAAVTVAIAAVIGVFVVLPMVTTMPESTVQLNIVAPGLDEGSSFIPVHVVGRDARGNGVDRTAYLGGMQNDFKLPDGTYKVSFLASPISAGGDLYQVEGVEVDLEITSSKDKAGVNEAQIELQVADPSDLPAEAIEAARKCARDGGMTADQVDSLLSHADGQAARFASGVAFASAQVYRGVTYVSDVRTNGGTVPVVGIPGAQSAPVEAERFLFADGFYYYPDIFRGNGSGTVALHRVNLATGEDTVLSNDVPAAANLAYADGKIAFPTYPNSECMVAVVNVDTGETVNLDFTMTRGLTTFLGVWDGVAYMTSSIANSPSRVFRCDLTGGTATEAFVLEDGAFPEAMNDGVIVVRRGNQAFGCDVAGNRIWSCDMSTSANLQSVYPSGNALCFLDQQGVLYKLDTHTGAIENHNTGVPRVLQVVFADDTAAYFCGGYDTSTPGIMGSAFDVFGLTFADGVLTDYSTGATSDASNAGPGTDTHVSTADFEFDLPEYWRGKVEWVEKTTDKGLSQVVIFPKGMGTIESDGSYEYRMVTVTAQPPDYHVTGGDIGGGLLESVDTGSKIVVAWSKNWTHFAYLKLTNAKYAKQYPDENFEVLIDLTTGGQLSYQDCRNSDNQVASHRYCEQLFKGNLVVK